jgi:hypothetical protein
MHCNATVARGVGRHVACGRAHVPLPPAISAQSSSSNFSLLAPLCPSLARLQSQLKMHGRWVRHSICTRLHAPGTKIRHGAAAWPGSFCSSVFWTAAASNERTNKQTNKAVSKVFRDPSSFRCDFFPFVSLLLHSVFIEYIWTEIPSLVWNSRSCPHA